MLRRPLSKRAFTLLELLVVITVIALLLALLMPALSGTQEMGRQAVCATNMHQLGIGSFAYSEANDNRLPWYANPIHRPPLWEWWVTQVARGMDAFEPQSYACPSDTVPKQIKLYLIKGNPYMADRGSHGGLPRSKRNRMSLKLTYRGSCDLLNYVDDGVTFCAKTALIACRLTKYERPEKAVLLVEGNTTRGYYTGMSPGEQNSCFQLEKLTTMTKGDRWINDSWRRHFGTTNVLFIDGHVSHHIPEDIGLIARNHEHRFYGH